MITGFNTDVKHKSKVFHVQTEDKGRNNPKIETLVYMGGEILDSYRTTYESDKKDMTEEEIIQLMKDAGIACMIADQNMSIVEGSIGILARRVLVDSEKVEQAKRIVRDAGIGAEIREN